MPTNYNFRNKNDYLKLKFPNISSSGRRLFLLGDQNGMTPGPNQENAAFRFANTSVVTLNSANLSPGKENEALRITPIGINNPWQAVDLYVALTPRPDLLDFVGGTTRTYRISFSYRANASSVGKTFSIGLQDVPFGGAGSVGYGNNTSITIANTNWNRVENISGSRTFAADRWIALDGFRALAPNNTWTSSDYIEIADFSFTWDEQPVTTTSFDNQFIPADTFRQGNLFMSGAGGSGQLGNNSTVSYSSLVIEFTKSSNWKQISTGDNHTAAIKTDGTLWSWGNNGNGQLGINLIGSNRLTPVREFTSSNNWTFVTCGGNNTAAIKSDGTLWLWGSGQFAQLGNNNSNNAPTPIREFSSSSNWKYVDIGTQPVRTFAIKSDGTLWVWGATNGIFSPGALGLNDSITGRSTPVQEWTSSNNWKKAIAQYNMSAGLKTDGTIWMWGYNNVGQIGVGGAGALSLSTPVQFLHNSFLGPVKELAGNGESFHAIKQNGTLWGWGRSSRGELGTNNIAGTTNTPLQEATSSTNWKKVFSDNSDNGGSKAAIKSDGSLWVWSAPFLYTGLNGLNNLIVYSSPVQVLPQNVKWKEACMGSGNASFLTYIDPII